MNQYCIAMILALPRLSWGHWDHKPEVLTTGRASNTFTFHSSWYHSREMPGDTRGGRTRKEAGQEMAISNPRSDKSGRQI